MSEHYMSGEQTADRGTGVINPEPRLAAFG